MKKLLRVPLVLGLMIASGCSTIEHGGGGYRDSNLSNANAAPAKLSPPTDYANPSENPTYLGAQADYHFTMGETLSFEGQSSKAIEEYKSTLVYDPKSVHVRLALAREFVRMGMMTEAVEQGETAVKLDPKNVDARMLLGGLYSGLKMFGPAREQFAAILIEEPGHAEAAVYLGALLAEERKYDEAIHYFESLTKNPAFKETEKAYYYIGRVRAEQGQPYFADAKKAFAKALTIKADYVEATLALATLLRSEKKDAEMATLLKSYQEKFGPDREMSRQLSHYYLEKEDYDLALEQLEIFDGFERDNLNIKIQIAILLIEQKRYETAAQRLEDVLLLAPDSDKVRYYLGAVYEELNRPNLALDHYAKIPAGSQYFSEATVHSAHLQKTAGRVDKAIEIVERALKQSDDQPQIYAYYATLLDESKQFKKGVKMLEGAVAKFPTNTQLRFFLGTMQDRVGNTEGTIAEMKRVLDLDGDHVQALNYLAYTFAETGANLDEAENLAARALKLQPNDGYILDTMGWIAFKRGRVEQAIILLEAAVKSRADEAIIAEHLGDAYLRHQMWQKALKMYQRAAQLEGDGGRFEKLQEKLAAVRSQAQPSNRSPASTP